MLDYQQKYLKYKNKYIELKNEINGGTRKSTPKSKLKKVKSPSIKQCPKHLITTERGNCSCPRSNPLLFQDYSKCVSTCPPGAYSVKGICTCSSFFDKENSKCVDKCPSGINNSNKNCCGVNQYLSSITYKKWDSSVASLVSVNGTKCVNKCPNNDYDSNKQCKS